MRLAPTRFERYLGLPGANRRPGGQDLDVDAAITDLIRVASDPVASPESLLEAIGPISSLLSTRDRKNAEALIRRLAEAVIDAPTRADLAGTIVLYCGALVERGLDPKIAVDPILDRLERQITIEAIAFVEACRQAAQDEPTDEPKSTGGEEEADPIERHSERIAAVMPTEARSFHALEPFSMAAIAMLARSAEVRESSRSRTALRASLDQLGGQYGHAGFLWTIIRVLDNEPIVVLHPRQTKGGS